MDFNKLLDEDDLFTTQVDEWSFTWRLLTVREYQRFDYLRATGQFHSYYLHSKVFERCYQGDMRWLSNNMPMFIPISIGEMILYLSGDCEVETVRQEIEMARGNYHAHSMVETFKRRILLAFTQYVPSDLDKLNRAQLINLFVRAEAFLSYKHGELYIPFDLNTITNAADVAAAQQSQAGLKPVNFELENAGMIDGIDPWAEDDLAEREFKQKPAGKGLTVEQAKKLDARR